MIQMLPKSCGLQDFVCLSPPTPSVLKVSLFFFETAVVGLVEPRRPQSTALGHNCEKLQGLNPEERDFPRFSF